MKNIIACLLLGLSLQVFCQNLPPALTNVQTELNGVILTINYDLEDAEGDLVTVTFRAGPSGSSFGFDTGNATGDLGAGITPGIGKQIQWDLSANIASLPNVQLMLVANDLQPVDIQAIVNQVDSTMLYGDVAFLEGIRHRTSGAAHLAACKDFIFNQFQNKNLAPYLQSFSYGTYDAANIIAQQTGTENENSVYILGGHFDSVNNSPGADDNASAVAGMLEAMRVLSGYHFKKTIRYIGFDLEEAGLVGSTRYVQQGIAPTESIDGMMSFEMIGYYTEAQNSQTLPAGFNFLYPQVYNEIASEGFRGNFITNVGEENQSVPLMNAFSNAAATYVPELSVKSIAAPSSWQALTPDLGRSDHAPFWVAGYPALMLTDGANFRNPNYHTPNDTLGSLNFTFMANVVKATVATLAELADIQHATVWRQDVELIVSTSEPSDCNFRISPNPSGNLLRLEWGNCFSTPTDIQLTDLQGRVHFTKKIQPGSETYFKVDVSGLERGVYFLKMGGVTEKVVLN